MSSTKWSRPRLSGSRFVIATAAVATLTAACSTSSDGDGNDPEDIRGQHITVVLPSYVNIPPSVLAKFEKETGVGVTLNVSSWDNIRDRIATAGAAGSAIADVTEFDWSWTGQFAGAGWYSPIENIIDPAVVADLQNSGAFTHDGHQYAVCYSNDARIALANTAMLNEAGLNRPPKTFDELGVAITKIIQSGGSEHPLALTLSATEGAVTQWNLLNVAMGGQILNSDNKAAFRSPDSPGYQALEFEVNALTNGWADPSSVSNDDQKTDALFLSGDAAFQLAGNPGEINTVNDPSRSEIAGKASYFLEPGTTGVGSTFGLPEGVGIPAASEHQAAAAAFINWMMEPAIQEDIFKTTGTLPCRTSTLKSLIAKKALSGGPVITKQLSHLVPLFPDGAPNWYPKFSADAAAAINGAATGSLTVEQAITRMADMVDQLAAQ